MDGKNPTMSPVYNRIGIRGYRLLNTEQESEVLAHIVYRPRLRQQCP